MQERKQKKMNNVMINLMISDYAKEIRQKIENGKIYGIPVDMENMDHVIVAVYHLCESEHLHRELEQQSIINTLFSSGRQL